MCTASAFAGGTPTDLPRVVDLAVIKTADRAQASPGDTVTWTVTVTNVGQADVPGSAFRVDDPGQVLTPNAAVPDVLHPGQSVVYRAVTQVAAEHCPTLKNSAWVAVNHTKKRPDVVDGNPANDASVATVAVVCPPVAPPPSPSTTTPSTTTTPITTTPAPPPVVTTGTPTTPPVVTPPPDVTPQACPRPLMRIGVIAPRRARPGRRVRVGVTVRNGSGRDAASKVLLTYAVPRGAVLLGRPRAAQLRHGVLRVRTATLAPRTKRTVWLSLRIRAGFRGRQVHGARVRVRCAAARTARTATLVPALPVPRPVPVPVAG